MKRRRIQSLAAAAVMALALPAFTFAPTPPVDRDDRPLPDKVAGLKLEAPVTANDVSIASLDASLLGKKGTAEVVVRLKDAAVAEQDLSDSAAATEKKAIQQEQASLLKRVKGLDPKARMGSQTQLVLNAIFVQVDAAVLPELAKDPAVERIAPVKNYELDLSETVPYVGASAVQQRGFTGKGVRVAVLDSGIDYTHAALGGSGNPADWGNNNPDVIERGTFPTRKVVGGYDFVGSQWPDGALAPDPDPLDDGPGGGHGTHVAHIIGGKGGVAPDVSLYAVKVCSSVSSSCSGVALIQGMEFALDPNRDGRLNDRVDIINMSLGSDYGQPFDDDLSAAVENATRVGVLTVASAGNGGDKPYVAGTPASAPSALSVAQTAVPAATLARMEIVSPAAQAGLYQAVHQPWSAPLTAAVEAPVQYGDGTGGNTNGCDPFTSGSLSGKIVLVNRGSCDFTLKISNIADGGAAAGIIGLVSTEEPFEGGRGAGDSAGEIPGFMISLAAANQLRADLPNTVARFDPAAGISLAGSVVGTSSRGPQHEDTALIKPEIGAPGASVSAVYGTGTVEEAFGGTSGAAPMVSGTAALLVQAGKAPRMIGKGQTLGWSLGRGLQPLEIKALLMNNAFTEVLDDAQAGTLAPITRIGGGEVRVDAALASPVAAWDKDVPSGSLSFGFRDVTGKVKLTKTVVIRNLDSPKRTYTVTPTFRFADDRANGAVQISAPSRVDVKAGRGKETTFTVTMTIDPAKLPGNFMNSGSQGANPDTLTANEFDGYLVLTDAANRAETLTIPWHVLPRQAAEVVPSATTITAGASPAVIGLDNRGAGTAQNDAYALLATSEDLPEGAAGTGAPTPDLRAVGINTFPVPAGFCSGQPSFLWAFAVNTWERQQHLLPVMHQIVLDTNGDGTDDYVVLNGDADLGTVSDGRQLTWVVDLQTGMADAWFYAEHATNTGNTALYVCAEQVGLTSADMLSTNVGMDVYATDFFHGGPGDAIEGLTVTPYGERFYGAPADVPGNTGDPEGLVVYDFGTFPGNTEEEGLMLLTNGDRGAGHRGGATEQTEALLLLVE